TKSQRRFTYDDVQEAINDLIAGKKRTIQLVGNKKKKKDDIKKSKKSK
ncbi:hypothetical protein LCGC14_2026860, partial [marine sediment metagenome]